MVVLAFAVAVGAAAALVVVALLLRNDETPPPPPSSALELTGIPQAGPLLGSPDAKVTLIEYADLQCPACRAYTDSIFPTLLDGYVRPGTVNTEFRGLAFIGPDSEKALRLVLAAGLQDHLWDLVGGLYRNQGGENDGWVTDEVVAQLSSEIGLDLEKLLADAQSDEVTAMMQESADQANAAEVQGTPSLFVQVGDAEPYFVQVQSPEELAAALDDALDG